MATLLVAADAFLEGIKILWARERGLEDDWTPRRIQSPADDADNRDDRDDADDDLPPIRFEDWRRPLRREDDYETYPTAKVREKLQEIGPTLIAEAARLKLAPMPITRYLSNGMRPEHANDAWTCAQTILTVAEQSEWRKQQAEAGNQQAEQKPDAGYTNDAEQQLQRGAQAVGDDTAAAVMAITQRTDWSADRKMSEIIRLDQRFRGKDSNDWATLLNVRPAAVRQTDTWKRLRSKKSTD